MDYGLGFFCSCLFRPISQKRGVRFLKGAKEGFKAKADEQKTCPVKRLSPSSPTAPFAKEREGA